MFRGPRKVELVGAACVMIVGTICVANLIAKHTHTHGIPEYEHKANQGAELLGTDFPKQAAQQTLYQVKRSSTDIVPPTTFEVLSDSASRDLRAMALQERGANKLSCKTAPAPKCKTKQGKGNCKFPFKHKRKWYNVCTDKGHTALWCKTAHGWGDCQSQARCTTAPVIADQGIFDQMVLRASARGFCNGDCTIADLKEYASKEGMHRNGQARDGHNKKVGKEGELGKWASKIAHGFTSCTEAEAVQGALATARASCKRCRWRRRRV